jgi:hypothetical protein
VLNELIKLYNARLNDDVKQAVAKERERRKNGGKVLPWEQCRKRNLQALKAIGSDEPMPVFAEDETPDPERCLSEESLGELVAAATAGKLGIRRTGPTIALDLPLAEADQRELVGLFAAAREVVLAKPKIKALPASVHELLEGLAVKPGDAGLLTLSGKLPARLESPVLEDVEPLTADQAIAQQETVAAIKAAGIKVREDVQVNDVVKRFFGDK